MDLTTLSADGSVLQIPAWKEMTWLRHGFGTRTGGASTVYRSETTAESSGDLNAGWTAADDPANVSENRRRLILAMEGASARLITVRQVHSSTSMVVSNEADRFFTSEGRAAIEADGLITRVPGVLLGIQTADCVPVLVVDVRLRVVAAFHAGWRGTVAGIVEKGIGQMVAECGSRSEHLMAAVGPSIGACCYSVGDEVRDAFASRFSYSAELFETRGSDAEQKVYLDLWEANRRQLRTAGVAESRISVVEECSGCAGLPERRRYFSHRCENGFTGRMMSLIGVVESGPVLS